MPVIEMVILALLFVNLGIGLAQHGEVKVKTENGWYSVISVALWFTLLWNAGLFH